MLLTSTGRLIGLDLCFKERTGREVRVDSLEGLYMRIVGGGAAVVVVVVLEWRPNDGSDIRGCQCCRGS